MSCFPVEENSLKKIDDKLELNYLSKSGVANLQNACYEWQEQPLCSTEQVRQGAESSSRSGRKEAGQQIGQEKGINSGTW